MYKKLTGIVILLFASSLCTLQAQDGKSHTRKTYRVGIFAPLYLDSVFNGNSYRYSRNFPRFILQGLDFVQGAQIAFDSMHIPNVDINANIYDSKSGKENIDSLIANKKLDKLDLIIGSVRDNDYHQLAGFALQKNIPFISATFPNDAGVSGNPFLVIVNSTLRSHCEAIYAYLLQSHGSDNILLCRKPGNQEDKVAGYLRELNQPDGRPLLNIQTVNIVDSNFNTIKYKLDSTKKNVIIGGSLDEYFAYNLSAEAAALNKTYPTTLVGMPNWDAFKSFNRKNSFNGFPVYFTAPYYNAKWDTYSKMIQGIYLKKYKGVPSEYSYKGFETVYLFTKLLTEYPNNFMSHLNDNPTKIFNDYNFMPVFNNGNTTSDYFENKHLYFLKLENGKVSKAW